MSAQLRLQDPGEGIHEAQILEVHVAEGDQVKEGDDLFTIETDKAAIVIPSPFDGTVDELTAHKGDSVRVGQVLLAYTSAEDGGIGSEKAKPEKDSIAKSAKNKAQIDAVESHRLQQIANAPDDDKAERADEKKAAPVAQLHGKPASPATRRLARELDVDLESIAGSGRNGRVEPQDVKLASKTPAQTARSTTNVASTAGEPSHGEPAEHGFDFTRWGEIDTVEESATRRRIAQKMDLAWRTVPHATHGDYVDVSKLETLRQKHAQRFREQGGKLTLTVFVLKAIAIAVHDFPRFNASLDPLSAKLVLKRYCSIGVAVDTADGLLVPVLRDVTGKSLAQLSRELADLTHKARDRRLKPADMQGGSITLTNPGSLGATFFTPIINYPEVAIVGLGTARVAATFGSPPSAAQHDGQFWLPLIIGFDHRVNDGADAARFARRIGELLADPQDMLLAM